MTFRTIVLASALIAGSVSFAVAQSGGDAGAGGSRNSGMAPAQNNQSGSTDPKGPSTATPGATTGTGSSTMQSGQMGDCPAGQSRTAAADGTKGPCRAN